MSFLSNAVVVYYAGFDEASLPMGEGRKLVESTVDLQITFLKALSLVADFIVIPPSFYFYWSKLQRSEKMMSELADLYQAGIILSPIYSSMADGRDFIEYKMSTGTAEEQGWIRSSEKNLSNFFSRIPIYHRNVVLQSGGFRSLILTELQDANITTRVRDAIEQRVREPRDDQVMASRSDVHLHLFSELRKGKIDTRTIRQLYYATNRAYYLQGAKTYGASISLVGAPRYSILGDQIFSDSEGILLAYDPKVILRIFRSLGIEDREVSSLSVINLVNLRWTQEFIDFRAAYREFSGSIQSLEKSARKLSRKSLDHIQTIIADQFVTRFRDEEIHYEKLYSRYGYTEMLTTSAVLGAIGMTLAPVAGFVLGFLPIVLHASGATPTLGKFILSKVTRQSTLFYRYVKAVRQAAEEAERLTKQG